MVQTVVNFIPQNVCYGQLGCFSNGSPFRSVHRLLSVAPESPDQIGTKFLLYTRENPTVATEELLREDGPSSISSSHYNGTRPTKIIIHGFSNGGHESWVQNMTTELLKNDDFNVIVVDWQKGADLPYEQATANTRVVGAQVAMLIAELMAETGQSAAAFHVIGHSLGAHTAGYAGQKTPGLGQITGLDPASPYFEGTDTIVRLDPSDATFVDVIHTDGGGIKNIGLGTNEPCGHADFYPNGGSQQPGCATDAVDKLGHSAWTAVTHLLDVYATEEVLACSHGRAHLYYIESINQQNCQFTSFPCASQDEFNKGHCLACSATGCAQMGYRALASGARGNFYLNTEDTPTFCGHTYVMNLTASNDFEGTLSLQLTGTLGTTKVVQLTSSGEFHQANSIISKLFLTREEIGEIQSVTLHYEKTNLPIVSSVYPDDWQLLGIALFDADRQKRQTFCAYHKELHNHNSTTFKVTGTC